MADYSKFEALNVQILGISSNIPFSQKTFADSLKLPYPLLSDAPDLKVIRNYGGLNPKVGYDDRAAMVLPHRSSGNRPGPVARIYNRGLSERADPEGSEGDCGEALGEPAKEAEANDAADNIQHGGVWNRRSFDRFQRGGGRAAGLTGTAKGTEPIGLSVFNASARVQRLHC
jgi:AhpC/TSA family